MQLRCGCILYQMVGGCGRCADARWRLQRHLAKLRWRRYSRLGGCRRYMPLDNLHLADGDKRILQKHLPNMTRWVEWCRIHSTDLIRDHDRNGDYGDWLAIGSNTPKDIIGTAFFAYSTHSGRAFVCGDRRFS